MTKFALLCYSTGNIGDEIQSVAAERFLPQVDYYLNRDYLHDFIADSTDEEIKLIMNGWYSHHPQNFPLKHPHTQLKSKIAEVQSLSTIDLS
ncbi:hypothetical protein HO412_10470 [Streptococcus suis]|nr:hypothetical protein [Streptococcus suis]